MSSFIGIMRKALHLTSETSDQGSILPAKHLTSEAGNICDKTILSFFTRGGTHNLKTVNLETNLKSYNIISSIVV
jgi:hypothetical protein